MRLVLDRFYATTLWLAALCLVAIAVLVGIQVGARVLDLVLKLFGQPSINFVVLSLPEIAGYLLAASSCFALAGTLKAGAHIRVTMALSAIGEGGRRVLELLIHAVGAFLAAYLTLAMGLLAADSFRFNELSNGLIAIPLGYPQAAMTAGFAALTIAFLDELAEVLRRGRPSYRAAEDAITIGKEG